MIKKNVITLIMLIFSIPFFLFSQELDNKKYAVGISVGYSQYNIDNIIDAATSAGFNYDKLNGGLSFSLKFLYKLSSRFTSYLNLGYSFGITDKDNILPLTDVSPEDLGGIQFNGEYMCNIIPASIVLLYSFNLDEIIVNIGGGPELFFNEISHAINFNKSEIQLGGETIKLKSSKNSQTNNGFGFLLFLRPEYKLQKNISLNCEIGYRFSSGDNSLNYKGLFFNIGADYSI